MKYNSTIEVGGEVMNKKELRHSFNQVIEAAGKIRCKDLHHKKSHEHEFDEMCPVEYELQRHAFNLRKHMKEIGL